jgi:chromate transporter
VLVIAAAGVVGWWLFELAEPRRPVSTGWPIGRGMAVGAWIAMGALLIALPVLRRLAPVEGLAVFDSFFRVGSLVFGGGHVVLPLLQAEVVPPGWVTNDAFVAGYGAAQAVPGPLFAFAAYLGVVMQPPAPSGVTGAALALGAIFLPAFLLVVGALPFWEALRARPGFQAALRGINAGVLGLLLAALYSPVWTSAIAGPADFALALAAFGLLTLWKLPPWLVVVLTAAGGALLGRAA